MRAPELPRHYLGRWRRCWSSRRWRVWTTFRLRTRSPMPAWPLQFFFLGAGFMLLETKSIVQFALLWGSTWSSASLAIASVLVMAMVSVAIAARVRSGSSWPLVVMLLALLACELLVPVGRVSFGSRLVESAFYARAGVQPVLCAGLLFSSSFRTSTSTAADFGANLFGAMVGRRRRVPVAAHRLPFSAGSRRWMLCAGGRGAETVNEKFSSGSTVGLHNLEHGRLQIFDGSGRRKPPAAFDCRPNQNRRRTSRRSIVNRQSIRNPQSKIRNVMARPIRRQIPRPVAWVQGDRGPGRLEDREQAPWRRTAA